MTHAPGAIRDTIVDYLRTLGSPATLAQISQGVINKIGDTSASSIRSSLNLHVGKSIERVGRGQYRIKAKGLNGHARGFADEYVNGHDIALPPAAAIDKARLYQADCFAWLAAQPDASIHA